MLNNQYYINCITTIVDSTLTILVTFLIKRTVSQRLHCIIQNLSDNPDPFGENKDIITAIKLSYFHIQTNAFES